MMYHIPAVLSPQEVDDFRAQLQQADWVDGRATTGDQGALVKKSAGRYPQPAVRRTAEQGPRGAQPQFAVLRRRAAQNPLQPAV
jgi:predicted 2-oxoglutarate/Fe(II)-dependent dioxygenase YbiX